MGAWDVPPPGPLLDPGTCRPTSPLRNVRSRSTRSLVRLLALPGQRVEHRDDPVARSHSGTSSSITPLIVPIRGHLDSIKRLMAGDVYIGRGSRQRGLEKSRWGNPFKLATHGRTRPIVVLRVAGFRRGVIFFGLDPIWRSLGEPLHAQSLTALIRSRFRHAHDRGILPQVPRLPRRSSILQRCVKNNRTTVDPQPTMVHTRRAQAGAAWVSPWWSGVLRWTDARFTGSPAR